MSSQISYSTGRTKRRPTVPISIPVVPPSSSTDPNETKDRWNIIIAVFHVDTVSEPLEFHWAFFIQYPGKDHGLKLHATDISDYWEYDAWPFTLSTSDSVAAAVIIGQIPSDRKAED